jgi:hypothetical protein
MHDVIVCIENPWLGLRNMVAYSTNCTVNELSIRKKRALDGQHSQQAEAEPSTV